MHPQASPSLHPLRKLGKLWLLGMQVAHLIQQVVMVPVGDSPMKMRYKLGWMPFAKARFISEDTWDTVLMLCHVPSPMCSTLAS